MAASNCRCRRYPAWRWSASAPTSTLSAWSMLEHVQEPVEVRSWPIEVKIGGCRNRSGNVEGKEDAERDRQSPPQLGGPAAGGREGNQDAQRHGDCRAVPPDSATHAEKKSARDRHDVTKN